jgi:hypothetical protein
VVGTLSNVQENATLGFADVISAKLLKSHPLSLFIQKILPDPIIQGHKSNPDVISHSVGIFKNSGIQNNLSDRFFMLYLKHEDVLAMCAAAIFAKIIIFNRF